ncbi:MAG: sigma-54 dependent transcriptional regulator [Chloroflexota bacterium]|nr:sigma-54 dependent transcriptional regulator [Chloroflexota bacterium]
MSSRASFYAKSSSVLREEDAFFPLGMVVGRSPEMQKIVSMIRQIAAYPGTTVLLQGESGTGKDVVAHTIHELGPRAHYPFMPLNCAAIPDTLLEAELFGVEAGAFTDAKMTREGYLLRADGGTLFLDEIASLPLALQAKLLRFLETRSFRRVGGTKEIHVDLRIISATNVDLQGAVAHKTFREDLFYRLNVITLLLPPLRERPEDIDALIDHFLHQCSVGSDEPLQINSEALELMRCYSWPGNIRQLRSFIQHGQILCDNYEICAKDLPEEIRRAASSDALHLRDIPQQLVLPSEGLDLHAFLGDIERKFVLDALERCYGNQVQAATLLHISRDQLRYRLKH